ncbi:MAG: MFS transporter [Robiginitomaculum sp.]|nr:MFS transporter [Robiginitomaculum sp.]
MSASFRIAAFYAALFLGLGGTFAFLPVWYEGRGLNGEWIGYALGAGALARFFAGPIVAAQASHPSHIPTILRWAAIIAVVIFIAHTPFRNPLIFVVLGLALGTAYAPLIPLTDALVMALERRKVLQYGPVRSAGSAAFIIGTMTCGWLIGKLGSEMLLYWAVGAGLLLAIAGGFLPKIESLEKAEAPSKARHRLRDALKFCARPDVALALLVTFLIQASHAFFYGFSALLWSAAGFTGLLIGALFAWGVLFEIVLFNLSPWFRKLTSPLILLLIGGVAALIRWLALSTEPELSALIGWQVLHGFSAAMTNLGMMSYLQKHTPERLLAGAQAVNSSITAGLSFGIGFAVAGILYQNSKAEGYLVAAAVAAIGVVICLGLYIFQARQKLKN